MSYNGSGTFVVNSSGQPVVTGTVISSTAFNALTADLATGLSTAITKDGQTTTTARIVFAQGVSSTLVTDATSATTGSIITAGGISCQKALWVGTTATIASTMTSDAHTITSTSANALAVGRQGTTNPVLNVDASTASVVTGFNIKGAAAGAGLALSVTSSGTNENLTIDAKGSGTITLGGTSTGAITLTRATTMSAALTYGGVTLSNSVTGTGSMVLSAGPTFTGTVTAPTVTASSQTIGTTASNPLIFNINGSEKARVGSDGSFLVGTTTNGGWSTAAIAEFKTTLQYGSSFYQSNNNGGYSASSFRLDYAGLLFAGFYHSTTQIGSITDVSGTSTAYNTTSDYRLKKNVRPMTGGLATISALKPVIYDWVKNDTMGEGFIAHELQAVIPIAVHGEKDAVNDDGSIRPQGVDFGKIVPHLVAALQELKAEFDVYKASHP